MATKCTVKVQCTNCLMEFDSEIYTRVDRTKDKNLINRVFKGKFNQIHCVHCENQGLVCFPVEFIDGEKGEKVTLIYLGTNSVPMRFDVMDVNGKVGVGVCPLMFKGFRVTQIIRGDRAEAVLYENMPEYPPARWGMNGMGFLAVRGGGAPRSSVALRRCKVKLRGVACATERSDTPQLAAGKFIRMRNSSPN